jgi:hypothetical protein
MVGPGLPIFQKSNSLINWQSAMWKTCEEDKEAMGENMDAATDKREPLIKRCGSLALMAMCVLVSYSGSVRADEPPKNWGAKQSQDIPLLNVEQEKQLDDMQAKASKTLLDTANWIDSFFDDDRVVAEENTTRGTIKLSVGYSRNDHFEIKPRFDWRLKLPKLSKRAQLFITAADDEDFDIENDPTANQDAHEGSDNNQLQAGLKWFLKESEKYNISVDTGLSWDYLFAGLRFRSIQDFGSWQGRFTDRLRYYTDDGLENKLAYDFERIFSAKMLFRTTTSVNWYEDHDGFPHSQYFKLYQVLSEYQVLSYESGIYLETEPSYKMDDLQFMVKYRQRFFRDWLALEIVPKITFPEDHDYEINPGIVFKLEASIGYRPYEAGYNSIFH